MSKKSHFLAIHSQELNEHEISNFANESDYIPINYNPVCFIFAIDNLQRLVFKENSAK